jgi:hypothetical protein
MDEIRNELLDGYAREGKFGHRQHLHMTWSYLCRGEGDRVLPFLRHVTESHGDHDKLNVTMTRFWVDATAHAMRTTEAESFERLLDAVPHLLDKALPFRHWSRETLFSPAARAEWVEPDLAPLPF